MFPSAKLPLPVRAQIESLQQLIESTNRSSLSGSLEPLPNTDFRKSIHLQDGINTLISWFQQLSSASSDGRGFKVIHLILDNCLIPLLGPRALEICSSSANTTNDID